MSSIVDSSAAGASGSCDQDAPRRVPGNRKRSGEPSLEVQPRAKRKKRSGRVNHPERATAHGSYSEYYKRRMDVVSRVRLLERGWVEGRVVLDIGCNDGAVVLALAKGPKRKRRHEAATNGAAQSVDGVGAQVTTVQEVAPEILSQGPAGHSSTVSSGVSLNVPRPGPPAPPSRIVGVDIDAGLVERARAQLRKERQNGTVRSPAVEFFCEDFAGENAGPISREMGAFDLVTVLSVTKWIHLYGGDAALKRLFSRVRDCLKPGGVFVLEPQPWASYKRARIKARKEAASSAAGASNGVAHSAQVSSEPAQENPPQRVPEGQGNQDNAAVSSGVSSKRDEEVQFDTTGLACVGSLKFRPEQFPEYLTSAEGGFSHMHMLRAVSCEKNRPFNRPVMAFFKRGE